MTGIKENFIKKEVETQIDRLIDKHTDRQIVPERKKKRE